VLFLALFFGFCVGMFYIAGWCFDNGQPYRIVSGADSWCVLHRVHPTVTTPTAP